MTTATAAASLNQIPSFETIHMRLPSSSGPNNNAGGGNSSYPALPPGIHTKRHNKFKLEPIRVLEPSSKKLNLPEAQRIMCIMDELIKKTEMLEFVYFMMKNTDRIRSIIQKHLNEEEKQRNYEDMFVSMLAYHKKLVDSYDSSKFNKQSQASSQTKAQAETLLKSSCKDILRIFSLKPSFLESIRAEFYKVEKKLKNKQIVELASSLTELKEIIHERLLTTPNEQNEKIDYLKELLTREKSNNEIIKKLQVEQNTILKDKEKDIKLRNDQIRKLDNDLKNVERFSSELIKRTKLDAEQQEASETKASDGRKAKLQQELNQLRQQFQSLVLEHREQEQQLRKEKWKNETNVEGILGRYDDDMTKKQSEFDEIEELHTEEKKQLEELEEKFKPLEEEYLKITEERRVAESLRRIEEESLNKKIIAAVTIQSFWRGFKLRKGLFKKGKGKKGKKGKKK